MILFGKQILLHLLENHPDRILTFYFSKELDKKLFERFARLNVPVERVDTKKAQAMARGRNHQGMLAEVSDLEYAPLTSLKSAQRLVALSGLTDVGNIGQIIRSAYALGIEGILIGGVQQVPLDGIIRSSSGAALEIPLVLAPNLHDAANELKQWGFELYAADGSGTNIKSVHFSTRSVLFMGSEDTGLPGRLLKKMDTILAIKMANNFDSLNVSAAAAIMMDRMRDE